MPKGDGSRRKARGHFDAVVPRIQTPAETSLRRQTNPTVWAKKQLTESDLRDHVLRNPAAFRASTKVSQELFDKWFALKEPSSAAKAIEKWNRDLRLKYHLTTAKWYSVIYGYGMVFLDYDDVSANDDEKALAAEVDPRASEVRKLVPISPMTGLGKPEFIVDENPRSDTYGDILQYKFHQQVKGYIKEYVIHGSRMKHVVPITLERDPRGIPLLQVMHNTLLAYDTTLWAISELIAKNAAPWIHAKPPAEGATKEEWDDAKEFLEDPRQRETLFTPAGWELILMGGGDKTLNPMNFVGPLGDALALGAGIPAQVLFGTHAGAITGSELNIVEWYSTLATEQENYWSPWLVDLYQDLARLGVLEIPEEADLELEWRPLFEMTETQKATLWKEKFAAIELGKRIGALLDVDEHANIVKIEFPKIEEQRKLTAARALAQQAPAPGELPRQLGIEPPPGSQAAGGNIPEQLRRREEERQ